MHTCTPETTSQRASADWWWMCTHGPPAAQTGTLSPARTCQSAHQACSLTHSLLRRSCAAQAYVCAAESPNYLPDVAGRGGASRAHLRGSCAACQDDGGAHVARDDVKDGARLQAEAIAQIECPMHAAFQMNWVLSLAHKGRLLRSTCPRGPYGMIVIHRSQLHGHTEHAPAAAG